MEKDNKDGNIENISGFFNRPNSLERFRNLNRKPFESLTEKEVEIVTLVARGMDNSEISGKLEVLPEEVKSLRLAIQNKLSIRNRADYIKYAFAFGLISF